MIKLWEEDCNRNSYSYNEISQKRWEDKNAAWFVKYEQSFRNIHANKNHFIKIGETAQTPRSYADAVSTPQYQPQTAEQQQQQAEGRQGQQVLGTEMIQIPLPQRPPRQRVQQPSPRQTGTETGSGGQRAPILHQGAENPPSNYHQRDEGQNEGQQYFLFRGRGRGRGRSRGQGRGRRRGRGRQPNMQ